MAKVKVPGAPSTVSKITAEFLGTFLLVFTVGCNVLSFNAAWGGVSIACVLMVAVYALGGISGGHFNPAVSCCLGLSKAMGGPGLGVKHHMLMFCAVQILAGILAGLAYSQLFHKSFNLAPAREFGLVHVGLCEMLYTFMLCFVVLNVAVATKTTPNQYYGLAIGFVIIAGAYGAGAISSGCFNPAVAIGIDLASAHLGFGWCKAYLIFEMLGGVLAALCFRVVRPDEFGGEKGALAELTSEFLGTFMLVLTVGLNVLGKSPCGAFSIAASLMCMVYALGDVSGAHFNPAVTFALALSGRCPDLSLGKVAGYWVAQVAGGVAAAFVYSAIYGGESFTLGPSKNYGWTEVFVTECSFTFVLCYVVLSVAVSKTTNSTQMFGLAIGSCITVGGNAIGNISGGYLNPAVNFGVAAGHRLADSSLANAAQYSAFQLVGAALAVGASAITHKVDRNSDKLNEKGVADESQTASDDDA